MSLEVITRVRAPAATIWDVLMDVGRWPEWNPSVERVARSADGEFKVGSEARIKQPRLLPMTWIVTELTPISSFAWEARSPGLVLRAGHELRPIDDVETEVRLTIEQAGVAAWLTRPFTSTLARRYVHMEAQGLKARAEVL